MVVKFREKKVCGPSKEKDKHIMKRVGKVFAKSLAKGVENLDETLKYTEANIFSTWAIDDVVK